MPGKRLSMRRIKEVLRLRFEVGLSHHLIAHSCGLGRTTVREYLQRAERAGVSWPLPEAMTDGDLEALLFPPPPPGGAARPLPDWQQLHEELKGRGVTLPVWMRQEHEAGEKLWTTRG